MAADSNMGFNQGMLQNRHMLSFHPGSGVDGMPAGMVGSVNMGNAGQIGSAASVFYPGRPNMTVGGMGAIGGPAGTSSGNGHLNPVARIKQQDSGLSPEWTLEEQQILKQGFFKYAGENSVMKYIKIAAMLPRKTVRDVALRCRWMAENGKRRKLEYAGKHNRKEKVIDSPLNMENHLVTSGAAASYPPMMHQVNQNQINPFPNEVPALDDATQQLMDENNQMLHQISANLSTYQILDNVDLFCHTRNNITTILNNMSNMPGIMSQMPPLPMPVNEELLNAILSGSNQAFMLNNPGAIHLDQQQAGIQLEQQAGVQLEQQARIHLDQQTGIHLDQQTGGIHDGLFQFEQQAGLRLEQQTGVHLQQQQQQQQLPHDHLL